MIDAVIWCIYAGPDIVYDFGIQVSTNHVAANDDGGFLVVWGQDISSPAGREIMARRVTSTTVAGSPITVTNGGTQGAPAATYNLDDDEYLLVWDVEDTYDAVWARRVKGITDTDQFAGDAFQVSGAEEADSGNPAVTYYTGGGGAYLVAWEQTVTGGELNLQGQRLTPVGTLSGATLELSSGSGDQSGVALGFGPVLSETLAAWSDERGTTADIYGRLVDLDGVLEAEGRLHPETGDQVQPNIAYNPDDDQYLVIWEDYRGGVDTDIYGQRVSGTGSLLGDNIAIKTGSGYQQKPHVAYGDGVYLTAWSDSSANAYGRVISPTGELATEDPLQITSASGFQQPTDIVYNEDLSQFLVLWRDKRGGDEGDIWGRHVSAGGTMGDEVQVTDTEDEEVFPVGAYNPDDQQYLIVWVERPDSGSDWDIAARRMVISETVVTTETISIAAESYDERYPDVTYLAEANRYVPVWNDYGTPQDVYDRLVKPDGSLALPF